MTAPHTTPRAAFPIRNDWLAGLQFTPMQLPPHLPEVFLSSSLTTSNQPVDPAFLANFPVPNVARHVPRLVSGSYTPTVPQVSPLAVVRTQTSDTKVLPSCS